MWGQVVVALRDDDTIRRRRADTDERTSTFGSVAADESAALRDRRSRGRRRHPDILSSGEIRRALARSPAQFETGAATEKITIAVLRVRGAWRLLRGHPLVGEYDDRVDAEEAGLDLTR